MEERLILVRLQDPALVFAFLGLVAQQLVLQGVMLQLEQRMPKDWVYIE